MIFLRGDQEGVWKHLTIVEREDSVEMYVDGQFVGKTELSFSRPLGGIWSIGGHNGYWNWGPMAQYSFWNRSLEVEETAIG